MDLTIPPRKTPARLPEVWRAQELERLFLATRSLKHRALLRTTYAAGLRVSEVVHWKVIDRDSITKVVYKTKRLDVPR